MSQQLNVKLDDETVCLSRAVAHGGVMFASLVPKARQIGNIGLHENDVQSAWNSEVMALTSYDPIGHPMGDLGHLGGHEMGHCQHNRA